MLILCAISCVLMPNKIGSIFDICSISLPVFIVAKLIISIVSNNE